MQVIDESAIARGMVRSDPGEDLLAALEGLANAAGWREAFVSGTGSLDLVELEVGSEVLSLERAELVSMSGHIVRPEQRAIARLHVQVLVGGRVHSGRVVAALTGPLLLVVEAALLPSAASSVGARAVPKAAASPVMEFRSRKANADMPGARPSSPGVPSTVFGVAPVVVPLGRVDASLAPIEDEYWMEVAAGDWLDHPQLGRGEVVGDDESGGMRVRIPSGRVCVLRLDTLEVAAPTEDAAGTRVFRVIGPKRRR